MVAPNVESDLPRSRADYQVFDEVGRSVKPAGPHVRLPERQKRNPALVLSGFQRIAADACAQGRDDASIAV